MESVTFPKGRLRSLDQNAKVSQLIVEDLEHLFDVHRDGEEALEDADAPDSKRVSKLEAHALQRQDRD